MKKVLYLTVADSVHDRRFTQTLVECGYEVNLLRVMEGNWPVPAGVKLLAPLGFDYPLPKDAVPEFTHRLGKVLDETKPDLVQAGPLYDLSYLAALSGAKPLLAQSWGFDLMAESFASAENLARTNFALSRSRALIVDARCSALKAQSLGFEPEKIYTFPWGIDLKQFDRAAWQKEAQEIRRQLGWEASRIIFCLRSWEPKYGVTDLCRAFIKAAEVAPELNLLLAGGGSEADLISGIFRNTGLEKRVKILGRLPNAELPKYFAAADIYVSPSHVDGSSVSLMEALASALPALVTDIPANLEWVQPGKNGWVYEDGNLEALTKTLVIASRASLGLLAGAARKTAEQKADWQKNKLVLMKAWQDCLVKG